MSLINAPMALLERVLARRTPPVHPDDPVARMVARTSGRLRPERVYRRRLRGRVVNQYVAMREGMVQVPARRRAMGRLGRAVLYASFGLAISVSAVGAASSSSLPGDALYPVKRQIEELRIEIAPPSVRPSLVAMALDARLSEVEQLAAAGRWDLVAATSADAAATEEWLIALSGSIPPDELARLERHVQVLSGLLATAPAAAQSGLEHALAVSSALHESTATRGLGGQGGNQGKGQGGGNGQGAAATPAASPTPTPTPRPTRSPKPTQPPEQSASPSAHPTHAPDASPSSSQS